MRPRHVYARPEGGGRDLPGLARPLSGAPRPREVERPGEKLPGGTWEEARPGEPAAARPRLLLRRAGELPLLPGDWARPRGCSSQGCGPARAKSGARLCWWLPECRSPFVNSRDGRGGDAMGGRRGLGKSAQICAEWPPLPPP